MASNAPHKPLLLLVVLDLAQEGELGSEALPLTPQLAFAFCSYWRIVAHRRKQKPDVRWPFTKLVTEGVWTPLDGRGEATRDPKQARAAKLDAGFIAAANDPAFREQARRILIAKRLKNHLVLCHRSANLNTWTQRPNAVNRERAFRHRVD